MIEADGFHDFGVQVDSFADMIASVSRPVNPTVLGCLANNPSTTVSFRSSTSLVIDQGNQTLELFQRSLSDLRRREDNEDR
jgi:hypothetical protein